MVAKKDAALNFDLIVLFDEAIHNIEMLEQTIVAIFSQYQPNNIVVADTTDHNNRTKALIDFADHYRQIDNLPGVNIDFAIDTKEQCLVIRRLGKKIKSKYFMVLKAGDLFEDLYELDSHLQTCRTRVIHWNFPRLYDNTILVEKYPIEGLYLTKPYQYFVDRTNLPFTAQLHKFECETDILLSHVFHRCVIRNGH